MELSVHNDNQIKEIPDIHPGIFKAASAGKLVVFIGAGVSRIIGCPSWKEFALKHLDDLRERKAINYYEYKSLCEYGVRKLLSICRQIREEKRLSPPNTKSFLEGDRDLRRKYKIYEDIYSFNVIYITTNYDDYLDQIAEASSPRLSSISETSLLAQTEHDTPKNKIIYSPDKLLVSNLTNGMVIHLHGSVEDEKSMIVTIVDYMNHYKPGSKPAALLKDIFEAFTVLFVGYGLEEYEILEFMISKSQTAQGELKHFMLRPIFKNEINLRQFQRNYYRDLGIQLVFYPIDNGYEHLATVISEWANQIGSISRPQRFLERIKLIDEVV